MVSQRFVFFKKENRLSASAPRIEQKVSRWDKEKNVLKNKPPINIITDLELREDATVQVMRACHFYTYLFQLYVLILRLGCLTRRGVDLYSRFILFSFFYLLARS